jgi:membrane-bound lytic murein transglycosylase A
LDARRHPQPDLTSVLIRRGLTLLAAALLLAGCGEAKKPPKAALGLRPVTFDELPGWASDRPSEAVPALQRSCARFAKLPAERPVGPGGLAGTIAEWQPLCAALATLPGGDDATRAFFETWFVPFLASSSTGGEGLFTGYYEPDLRGSRVRDDAHPAPLYRIPDDLVTVDLGDFRADYKGESIVGRVDGHRFKPYFSREKIEGGAIAGQGAELVWVESTIDSFFLQIQGSGRVQFADGSTTRVGFAATNGQPYYPIARALLENGTFKKGEASMQRLSAWLRSHPDQADALMNRNRSYVFFREIAGDGPIGAQGVVLTAGRSLAVDPAYLALGGPLWLDTTWPRDTPQGGQPLQRLLIAQDTGGAIKGPVRGDIFWGTGDPALAIAGTMQQAGRYFLLLPKPAADRRVTLIARGMMP